MMFEFKFPDIGEGVHEGKILSLRVNPGDNVKEGDILAEVETDKVVAEIPAPKTGVLKKFGFQEGEIVKVGEVLAYIMTSAVEEKAPDNGGNDQSLKVVDSEPEEDNAGVVGEIKLGNEIMSSSTEGRTSVGKNDISKIDSSNKVLASPSVRRLASDLNIELSSVSGSGPDGRILARDVARFGSQFQGSSSQEIISEKDLMAAAPQGGEIIPLSTLRKTLAKNMAVSQSIPTAVLQDTAIVDELMEFRKEINENREDRISIQPFFIKALAIALKKFPILNTSYNPMREEIIQHKVVNIGIAVDTEAGLMVPVINDVDKKNIIEINTELRELVDGVKKRTIALSKLRGGTITISNFGSFGGTYSRPMILPPQTAIIGFGRIHQAPVVKNIDGSSEVAPGWVLPVSIPFDHRVIDGATAASFLTYFTGLLNSPKSMLLSI